jgi:oxygen-dependent protoporphyrinogen oxidase
VSQPRAIVIGAGMAGLTAARCLAQRGVGVTVLEQRRRVGGRVKSWPTTGRVVELGAQCLATPYARTLGLCAETGLGRGLVHKTQPNGILRGGVVYPVAPGPGALFSPLLSASDRVGLLKLATRLIADWRWLDAYHPEQAAALDTESTADYLRRLGGESVLGTLFEPTLSGLLYWDAERTSRAMLLLLLKEATSLPAFLAVRGGLARLPESLAESLDVRCGAKVTSVTEDGSGGYLVHALMDGEERALHADGVVCATPTPFVPALVPSLDAAQRRFFQDVTYSSTVVAVVGLPRRVPVPVFSLFFTRSGGGRIAAITVDSNKDRSNHDEGSDVVQVFATDAAARELRERDDDAIYRTLWPALLDTGIAHDALAEPEFRRIQRWDLALPRFDVGHFRRLRAFAAGAIEPGRIVFAGDYLVGPYVEGAVVSGMRAADRLLLRLGAPASA